MATSGFSQEQRALLTDLLLQELITAYSAATAAGHDPAAVGANIEERIRRVERPAEPDEHPTA